jgi:hypothetical protein
MKLFRWISKGKFNVTGAKDMRNLWDVLESDVALEALTTKGGTYKDAIRILEDEGTLLSEAAPSESSKEWFMRFVRFHGTSWNLGTERGQNSNAHVAHQGG